MRALIQRVSEASVEIDDKPHSKISCGLLILLGIEEEDQVDDIQYLVRKISQMRIFPDAQGVMNLSMLDINAEVLVVSQFTLHASTKKGNRPSYIKAAKPNIAIPLYEQFITHFQGQISRKIQTGEFGADMQVKLVNDGPVTIWLDSKNIE